jgi:hypothetical protein
VERSNADPIKNVTLEIVNWPRGGKDESEFRRELLADW